MVQIGGCKLLIIWPAHGSGRQVLPEGFLGQISDRFINPLSSNDPQKSYIKKYLLNRSTGRCVKRCKISDIANRRRLHTNE